MTHSRAAKPRYVPVLFVPNYQFAVETIILQQKTKAQLAALLKRMRAAGQVH